MSQPFYATQRHPSPVYNRQLSNGAPLYELSKSDMAAAGSVPLGYGRVKPNNAPAVPQAAPANAAMPNTAAAAAAMHQQQQQITAQQQQLAAQQQQLVAQQQQIARQVLIAAQVVPTPALVAASMYPAMKPTAAPIQQQQQQQGVPTSLAAAHNYQGPVAGAGLDCSDFTKTIGGNVKTRVITAYATVMPAQHNTKCISIKLDDEQMQEILKYKHSGSPDARDSDLSRVMIMGINLLNAKNKLPIAMALQITGCKGRDYDACTRARGLLILPPGYKTDCEGAPRALHRYAPQVSMHAFFRFGNVTPVPDKAWLLVNVNSPIVEIIKASQAELKSTLQEVKIIEGMMPVKNELVDSVKQFLQENTAKFPGTDCTKFSIDFARSAGCHFSDKGELNSTEEQINFAMRHAKPAYVKLSVSYVIISNTHVGNKMAQTAASAARVEAPKGL